MDRIVILTGAGISAESGLGTFRDAGGLWAEHDLTKVATPEGFARNPGLVHEFYNARRANCLSAEPNAAHRALARLQRAQPDRVAIVTQNIDDLHERGGAQNVIHMHGEFLGALCAACGHRWPAPAAMSPDTLCPSCNAQAARPDVVWFGEYPCHMDRIDDLLTRATLFVAIGTSGQVYPAAGFAARARASGAATLALNLDPSDTLDAFDRRIIGPATETVPAWVDDVRSS